MTTNKNKKDFAQGSGSTWTDNLGDPSIEVGALVLVGAHRQIGAFGTNMGADLRELVGRVCVVTADHGANRPSHLHYISVEPFHASLPKPSEDVWTRVRDCVLLRYAPTKIGPYAGKLTPAGRVLNHLAENHHKTWPYLYALTNEIGVGNESYGSWLTDKLGLVAPVDPANCPVYVVSGRLEHILPGFELLPEATPEPRLMPSTSPGIGKTTDVGIVYGRDMAAKSMMHAQLAEASATRARANMQQLPPGSTLIAETHDSRIVGVDPARLEQYVREQLLKEQLRAPCEPLPAEPRGGPPLSEVGKAEQDTSRAFIGPSGTASKAIADDVDNFVNRTITCGKLPPNVDALALGRAIHTAIASYYANDRKPPTLERLRAICLGTLAGLVTEKTEATTEAVKKNTARPDAVDEKGNVHDVKTSTIPLPGAPVEIAQSMGWLRYQLERSRYIGPHPLDVLQAIARSTLALHKGLPGQVRNTIENMVGCSEGEDAATMNAECRAIRHRGATVNVGSIDAYVAKYDPTAGCSEQAVNAVREQVRWLTGRDPTAPKKTRTAPPEGIGSWLHEPVGRCTLPCDVKRKP